VTCLGALYLGDGRCQFRRLRKIHPVLAHLSKRDMEGKVEGETIVMRRWTGDREALILFNFGVGDIIRRSRYC